MSIQSGMGAACAAGEIITLCDKLIKEAKTKELPNGKLINFSEDAVTSVLQKVKTKTQQIKEAGDSGWY